MIAARPGFLEGIGYLAAFCTTFAFVPQLVRVLKLKSARDVSLSMLVIFNVGVAAWLIYGFILHSWPVILANAATLLLSTSLLGVKLYYSGRDGS